MAGTGQTGCPRHTRVHYRIFTPPLGSEMAISSSGDVQGYVSGGCVEAAVAAEALQCLQDRTPRLLDYGAGSSVLDIQLTCGGRISIFVRPIANLATHVEALRNARTSRQAIALVTDLQTGIMHFAHTPPLSEEGKYLCGIILHH